MQNSKDPFQIKSNFLALSVIILIVLVAVDIVLRLKPEALGVGSGRKAMAAVGHHHQFSDGSSYYIYTIFEDDGDVYQCWYDEKTWNQKKVTNYKSYDQQGGLSR